MDCKLFDMQYLLNYLLRLYVFALQPSLRKVVQPHLLNYRKRIRHSALSSITVDSSLITLSHPSHVFYYSALALPHKEAATYHGHVLVATSHHRQEL